MNQLQKAYATLTLEPGSSREIVQTRWKRLVMVWHPDRFPTDEGKADAEEELKKINMAKDLLFKHFDSGEHKSADCECQAASNQSTGAASQSSKSGPGPGRSRTSDPEAEAKRRDEERKRRAAGNTNNPPPPPPPPPAPNPSQDEAFGDVKDQESALAQHRLKWKIAKIEAFVFVGMCVFGAIGTSINEGIHKWQVNEQQKQIAAAQREAVKNDPCQSGTAVIPPTFAMTYVKMEAQQAAKTWKTNCNGIAVGATVTGEDGQGRLVDTLYFGPNLSYQGQIVITYDWQLVSPASEKTTVSAWRAPDHLDGKTIYTYDGRHNLIEIRSLDSSDQPSTIATIERRPDGTFFAVDLQFVGQNRTTKVYSTDSPEVSKNFILFEKFGQIAKQVDLASTLASPDPPVSVPSPGRASPFSSPFSTPGALMPTDSSTSTGTNTSELSPSADHLKMSPFGAGTQSVTPNTDSLLEKLKERNNDSNR